MGDAALHLAVHDQRVDDVAAVVRHRVVEPLPPVIGSTSTSATCVPLQYDACGGVNRRCARGRAPGRAQMRTRHARARRASSPSDIDFVAAAGGGAPILDVDLGLRHAQRARGERDDLLCTLSPAISADEPALIACRLAKAPMPCEIAPVSPTVMTMSSIRQPTWSATICARSWCLALGGGAGRDRDLAVREHAHAHALERTEPGALDVVADPDAEIAALGALRLAGAKARVVGQASARVWLLGNRRWRRPAACRREHQPDRIEHLRGEIMLRERTSARSSLSSRATRSISRSMANTACGRPAPRTTVVGTGWSAPRWSRSCRPAPHRVRGT